MLRWIGFTNDTDRMCSGCVGHIRLVLFPIAPTFPSSRPWIHRAPLGQKRNGVVRKEACFPCIDEAM